LYIASVTCIISKAYVRVRILQQLLRFGVVLGFELVVIEKVLFLALMMIDLETMAVERILVLFSGDIVDNYFLRHAGTVISLWPAG
jgi:hypothetical protein